MKKHPFEIPEIFGLIGQFLDHKDHLDCIRVCKSFHDAFVPYIWRKVKISNNDPKYETADFRQGLQRYKHHIQSLETHSRPEHFSLRGCAYLEDLSIYERQDDGAHQTEILSQIADLIAAHSSTLRRVTIHTDYGKRPVAPRKLWSALEQCLALDHLAVLVVEVHDDDIDEFLAACARPRKLEMSGVTIPECLVEYAGFNEEKHDDENDNGKRGVVIAGPRTLISRRDFRHYPASSFYAQALFVRKCHNLKALTWDEKNHPIFFQTLAKNPWTLPNLESVSFGYKSVGDQELAGVLRQMHRLKVLKAGLTGFGPLSFQALVEATVLRRPLTDSIETLDLLECNVTSKMIQAILASCPKLVDFTAGTIAITDIACGENWVCTGIHTLSFYIVSDVESDTDNGQAMHRAVHSQLGRLTNLRTLEITGWTDFGDAGPTLDLRLKTGLAQLAGLKCLEVLRFGRDEPQQIGVEEAKWMIDNWPWGMFLYGWVCEDVEKEVHEILWSKAISMV